MATVIGAPAEVVAWNYGATTFTAPISGVIVGGILVTCLGGYNDPRAQHM